MGEADLLTFSDMLDQTLNLGISNRPTSACREIGFMSENVEFIEPRTTRLVVMIENLTNVLDYASEEAIDME